MTKNLGENMTDRSAVDTIKGYFYQFDMSILKVLSLPNADDSISIECIEDIDLQTATELTAIQCKYYAKTAYTHSVIKEAVRYMLSHFKETKSGKKPVVMYAIRGHYSAGQEKLRDGINVKFLKENFLTYTTEKVEHRHHVDLDLNDDELAEFLARLTVDINAPEFNKQLQEVVRLLQVNFNCNIFTAEFFYYNNALRVIKELAVSTNQTARTITKKAFLKRIDTSSVLFNEWFVQKKGKKLHLAALRKEYFTELNVSPFERFFLVELDRASYARSELKHVIFLLSKKWSKTTQREPKPFCPYLFIQGISDEELRNVKNELFAEGFKLIDGYRYKDAAFSLDAITEAATCSNEIKIKILDSVSNLKATINSIQNKTRKIYQFHLGESYFELTDPAVTHVKIQIQNLTDIKEII